jgi:hypothetical protein
MQAIVLGLYKDLLERGVTSDVLHRHCVNNTLDQLVH